MCDICPITTIRDFNYTRGYMYGMYTFDNTRTQLRVKNLHWEAMVEGKWELYSTVNLYEIYGMTLNNAN